MDVWYFQGVGDINNFLRLFKIRIKDIYMSKTGMQDLKIQAELGSILRFRTFSFKNTWISYHQKNIEKVYVD